MFILRTPAPAECARKALTKARGKIQRQNLQSKQIRARQIAFDDARPSGTAQRQHSSNPIQFTVHSPRCGTRFDPPPAQTTDEGKHGARAQPLRHGRAARTGGGLRQAYKTRATSLDSERAQQHRLDSNKSSLVRGRRSRGANGAGNERVQKGVAYASIIARIIPVPVQYRHHAQRGRRVSMYTSARRDTLTPTSTKPPR